MKKILTICAVAGLFVGDAEAMNVPFNEYPDDIRNDLRDFSHFRKEKAKFESQKARAEAQKARVDAGAYANEKKIRKFTREILEKNLKQQLDELKEKEKEEKKEKAREKRWGYRLKKWADRKKNYAEGWFYRGKGVASVVRSIAIRFPVYGSAFFPGFASVLTRGLFRTLPWGLSWLPGGSSNGYLINGLSSLGSFLSGNSFLVSGGLVTAANVWVNGYEGILERVQDFWEDLSNGFTRGNFHLKEADNAFRGLIEFSEGSEIEKKVDFTREIEALKAERTTSEVEKAHLLSVKSIVDQEMEKSDEKIKELGKRSKELEKKGRVNGNFWDYLLRTSCTKKIGALEADLNKLEKKKKKLGRTLVAARKGAISLNEEDVSRLNEEIKSLTTKYESISKRIGELKEQEKKVREEREALHCELLKLDEKREDLRGEMENLLVKLAVEDEKISSVNSELGAVRRDMLVRPLKKVGFAVNGVFQRGRKFADIFWNVGASVVSYGKSSLKFMAVDVPSLVISSAPGFTSLLLYDAMRSYGHHVWGPVSYPAVSYILAGGVSSLCNCHFYGSYAWDQFWQHLNNGLGYFEKSAEYFEEADYEGKFFPISRFCVNLGRKGLSLIGSTQPYDDF